MQILNKIIFSEKNENSVSKETGVFSPPVNLLFQDSFNLSYFV